jgi:predicted nuclease of predicted toxin-antitoxin system
MQLLLDANISWRLAAKLKLHFGECLHVDRIGLNIPASDTEIWNYALINN